MKLLTFLRRFLFSSYFTCNSHTSLKWYSSGSGLLVLAMVLGAQGCRTGNTEKPVESYAQLQEQLLKGWNTWDNRSVSTFVLLPEGLSFSLRIADTISHDTLRLMFTGNRISGTEQVRTIAHTPDGSFTDFTVLWRKFGVRIQSVSEGKDLDILVIPSDTLPNPGKLIIDAALLYKKPGTIELQNNAWIAELPSGSLEFRAYAENQVSPENFQSGFTVQQTLGFSTRNPGSLGDIRSRVEESSRWYWEKIQAQDQLSEVYNVMQNAVNWLVVYDPAKNRAITPVSRPWSYGWGNGKEGGYVLFCWDNFFASFMHSLESKELAFNEAIQMCREIDDCGFVPNFSATGDVKSRDRSQPPVGSMMVLEIYKRHPEKWFLEEVFNRLMTWNRWWPTHRDTAGYLCWGSDPAPTPNNDPREKEQNSYQAALYESGLDNSPMYDAAIFDTASHLLLMADAGLMGLYIADCNALAEIASVLGKTEEENELKERSKKYSEKLSTMWDEEKGIYLNFDLINQRPSDRISPTNFYPLLGKVATQAQAERMVREHFYNPEEFWGDFIMPSIARSDTGYTGKEYWRGSIWAPMNFLVYLGMRNYELADARKDLAEKSVKILLAEWNCNGYIRENYDANTGGDPGARSDHYYHWGALLGMIYYLENVKKP